MIRVVLSGLLVRLFCHFYRRRIACPVEQGAPDVAHTKESKRHDAAALPRNTSAADGHRRACSGRGGTGFNGTHEGQGPPHD